VQFATSSVGALSTSVFGLDFLPAAIAIVLGTVISACLIALLSTHGAQTGVVQTGVVQLIQTRAPFGWFVNLPAAAITVINGFGWYAVDTLLGIFILRNLLGIGLLPALVIMAAAQLSVPVFGYRMIHSLERVLAILLLAVFVVVSFYRFGHAHIAAPAKPFAGGVGAFVLTVSVTSARALGWSAYSSDYSRYLPAGTRPARIFGAAAGGSAVAGAWIGVLGAALGTVGTVSDPSAMVSVQLPSVLGAVTLLALLASTLASTVLDLYSGAMASLVAGIHIPRWVSVVGVCGLGTVLTWFAGQNDFATQFQNFLLIMSYWLAPWAAVTVVAFWWSERGRKPNLTQLYDRSHRFGCGLPATLLGVAGAVPFMNQSLYTGPTAAAHPGLGGLGHVVGFAVAGLAYAALTSRKSVTSD
jgi:NCS1 family nucleobase:cation symporter-1